MLEQMRKQSQNGFLLFGLGIIIFVFIFFFGPQSSGFDPSQRRWVGEAAGETFFDKEVLAAYERYLALTGRRDRLSEAEFAAVRRAIITDFGASELLAREARRAGLAVSSDELRCYIVNWHSGYSLKGERICRQFPRHYQETYRNFDFLFYSEDGVLRSSYKSEVRARFAMSVEDYEAGKRDQLLALKYLDLLASGVTVSRAEAESIWRRRNETVDLAYVAFDPATVTGPAVDDESASAWALENEAAIIAAYEADRSAYTSPRQVRLRRIFMNAGTSDEERETARARYETALERAQAGTEAFEALAREFSDLESERENGGDFGWRSVNEMSRQLAERTETMNVGDVAGVTFDTYYNIIQLEEVREESVRPLDEVRDDIARRLLSDAQRENALRELRDHANTLLALASEGIPLEEALAALRERVGENVLPASVEVRTTGAFARERTGDVLQGFGPNGTDFRLPPPPPDRIPGIGTSRTVAREAFLRTEEAPFFAEPVEVEGKLYVIRLQERVVPAEVDETSLATLVSELAIERADAIVGNQQARLRLLLHDRADSLGPVTDRLVAAAIASGELRFNEAMLAFDPADDLAR